MLSRRLSETSINNCADLARSMTAIGNPPMFDNGTFQCRSLVPSKLTLSVAAVVNRLMPSLMRQLLTEGKIYRTLGLNLLRPAFLSKTNQQ